MSQNIPKTSPRAIEEGEIFSPRFDDAGLMVCIAQDAQTKDVLMVAFMNAQALRLTIETGIVHYWSRSRQEIWRKGETSGQLQSVRELRVDCDQDAVLALVTPGGDGGACHTGRRSCFYRQISGDRLKFIEGAPKSPNAPTRRTD